VSDLDTSVTLSTTATAASAVGTYPITASGAADANYTVGFVNATLSVTSAPLLIITSDDQFKQYGAPMPTLTASYSGFINGDTPASLTTPVSLSTSATASSPVGSYSIVASGATDPNYDITFVNLQCDERNNHRRSVLYGAAVPALECRYSGFVNGQAVAGLDGWLVLSRRHVAGARGSDLKASDCGCHDHFVVRHDRTPGTLTITANDFKGVWAACRCQRQLLVLLMGYGGHTGYAGRLSSTGRLAVCWHLSNYGRRCGCQLHDQLRCGHTHRHTKGSDDHRRC
jgi:hypothetical protein